MDIVETPFTESLIDFLCEKPRENPVSPVRDIDDAWQDFLDFMVSGVMLYPYIEDDMLPF